MTNKEKQLIIDSLHHWYVDCVDILQGGEMVIGDKFNSHHCPLCKVFLKNRCKGCLWVAHSLENKICTDEEWWVWRNERSIESAYAIVNKLWAIGTQYFDYKNPYYWDMELFNILIDVNPSTYYY